VRVLKAGFRYGDMAPMAIIEFVDRDPDAKGAPPTGREIPGRLCAAPKACASLWQKDPVRSPWSYHSPDVFECNYFCG
jgi:hypothetical protein